MTTGYSRTKGDEDDYYGKFLTGSIDDEDFTCTELEVFALE